MSTSRSAANKPSILTSPPERFEELTRTPQRLLLLAPSHGFGGGIERVAAAIEGCWPGSCVRVDLYRRERCDRAAGSTLTKGGFTARALAAGLKQLPDIVLALHVGLLPVALGVALAVRARTALMGIGHEVWGDLGAHTRRMIGRCSHLLSISEFTTARLAQRSGISADRVSTVPLPVDEHIMNLAEQARPRSREPILLTVSRIVANARYKGHWAIAESLPGLLANRPDARWHVVGEGDDVVALQDRCANLGVASAVRFEGLVCDERLAALYAQASTLVLPSVTAADALPPTGEGFGLVYAEAGAFGLPSIASTASGGAADFVSHGRTGLTVRPQDADGLTAAMSVLLDDGALRDRLGACARAQVHARHTSAHFASALCQALDA